MRKQLASYAALLFRLLLILVMIVALYSYAMFQGGFISWFLFYSVATLVLIGLLTTISPLGMLEIKRTIRQRQLKNGEHTTVEITIQKKGILPLLYIGVFDIVPKGIRIESHPGSFFFMLFSKEKQYSYVVKGVQRGMYRFESVAVETGDMVGFFKRKKEIAVVNEISVYPRLAALPESFVNKKLHMNNRAKLDGGGSTRMSFEETLDFSNVREYVAGDKLSSIDWKVSARQGKLATKEFDTEESKGYSVLFDSRCEHADAFESAIEWTAGIVNYSFDQGAVVNFASFGEDIITTKKGNDQAHLRHVMNVLVQLQAEKENTKRSSMNKAFQFLNTVVYIAPTLHKETLQDIRRLSHKGYHLIVLYSEREAANIELKQLRIPAIQMPLTVRNSSQPYKRQRRSKS